MNSLVVSMMTAFSCVTVQTAEAAQSIPAYADTLRRAVVFENESGNKLSLADRMERWKVPGMSVAVIDNCKIVDRHGFGITRKDGAKIQSDTLFQAASVTKPVAAFAALRLVDQGLLSLDSDVNVELQSWKVPASPFLEGHPITLRGILSHSAGLIPGGYGGYSHGELIPTLLQTLNGVEPARPKPVQVAYVPGSDWRYSGGGYLVAQVLMTEKTGRSFDKIVLDQVLEPTGMIRSDFAEPSASARADVAAGHVADGSMVPGGWHVYPELAAAGLWSTAPDLASFGLAMMKAVREEPNTLLSPALANQMATVQSGPRSLGFEVGGEGKARHFGHDGTNEGYNSSLILYPETCQGAAIMTNSDNAKPLIAELLRSIADTYHWPDAMPSTVMNLDPKSPIAVARFQGTYSFTDISGVAPFKIISTGNGSFTFDRADPTRKTTVPMRRFVDRDQHCAATAGASSLRGPDMGPMTLRRCAMALPTRWNPFRQDNRLDWFPELEDLVRNLGARGPLARQYEHMLEMRMDVREDEQGYHVKVDVPGVKKEDIDISIEGNQVTITAEAKREKKREEQKELYSERYEGQAYRSFTLPSEIDDARAEAHYDGGVLSLLLPKKPGNGSRKLTVN